MIARGVLEYPAPLLRVARVVGRADDPRAAWEGLASAGLIPFAWVDDPARRFWRGPAPASHAARAPFGARADRQPGLLRPHPTTRAACVALASDVAGVLAAEALAAECAARLAPWRHPEAPPAGRAGAPFVVTWRLVDPARDAPAGDYCRPVGFAGPTTTLVRNGGIFWVVPVASGDPRAEWDAWAATARLHRGEWAAQARAGRKIAPPRGGPAGPQFGPSASDAPPALWKAKLRTLPDPFAPAAAIWEAGYGVEAIGAAGATLVAAAGEDEAES